MSTPREFWQEPFLLQAVARIYENDYHAIRGCQERCATALLTDHLRMVLRERGFFDLYSFMRVDTEYLRVGTGMRRKVNNWSPDVIVHCPDNSDHNTVVVEAKGYWNPEPREYDREKLFGYLDTLQYAFAYLVEFLPDHATVERVMLE